MRKKPKRRLGIECLFCGWIGISQSRHDFRMCRCENQAFVDGGDAYLRYGAEKLEMIRRVSISDASYIAGLAKLPAQYFYGVGDEESGNFYSSKGDLHVCEDMTFVDEILKLKVVKRIPVKKTKSARKTKAA